MLAIPGISRDRPSVARRKSSESFRPSPPANRPSRRLSSDKGDPEVPDSSSGRSSNLARWKSSDALPQELQPFPMRPLRRASIRDDDEDSLELSVGSSLALWTSSDSLLVSPNHPERTSLEGLLPLPPTCSVRQENKIYELEISDGSDSENLNRPDKPQMSSSNPFESDCPPLKRNASLCRARPQRNASNTLADMQRSLCDLNYVHPIRTSDAMPAAPEPSQERPKRTAPARTISESAHRMNAPARTFSELVPRTSAPAMPTVSQSRFSSKPSQAPAQSLQRQPMRSLPMRTSSEQVSRTKCVAGAGSGQGFQRRAPERTISERVSPAFEAETRSSSGTDMIKTGLHMPPAETSLAEHDTEDSSSSALSSEPSYIPIVRLVRHSSMSLPLPLSRKPSSMVRRQVGMS